MKKQIYFCASTCMSDKERNKRLWSVGKILMLYVPFSIRFHKKKLGKVTYFLSFPNLVHSLEVSWSLSSLAQFVFAIWSLKIFMIWPNSALERCLQTTQATICPTDWLLLPWLLVFASFQYETCFWHLEFWSFSKTFGKFVNPWPSQYILNGLSWRAQ